MWKLMRLLMLGSLVAVVMGCAESKVAVFRTHFGGVVLNGDTKQPVSGVVVTLCNYTRTATTDSQGRWQMDLIPGIHGTYVHFSFSRSGLASTGTTVGVFPNSDMLDESETTHFVDVGTIEMRPGVTLTTIVTRDGSPLANCAVMAIPEVFSFDGTTVCVIIVAVTNSSGIATLANLDPTIYYEIIIQEQDFDGDNIPDIFGESEEHNISWEGTTLAMNVESRMPSTLPFITGTDLSENWDSVNMPTGPINDTIRNTSSFGWADLNQRLSTLNEEVNFSESNTMASGAVRVVLSGPLSVVSPNFLYRDNLRDPTVAGYNDDVRIPATAVVLTGTNNTVYTITPSTPLPDNEVFTLNFIGRSLVDSASSQNYTLDFYRPILGNSSIPVRADNYNGSRDGTGLSNQVYLAFQEVVWGFYKLRGYTQDGSAFTIESPSENFFYFNDDDAIAHNLVAAPATGMNVGQSGAVVGNAYTNRVRFAPFSSFLFLNDDATLANSITIELSCVDAEGNIFDGVLTLIIE
jgi:hypothetical protein